MSKKVWNLMYRLGTTENVVSSSDNPSTKKTALEGAAVITKNGWRVWVEHHESGKVLYRNPAEVKHQQDIERKRIIKFAEENVPGYSRSR